MWRARHQYGQVRVTHEPSGLFVTITLHRRLSPYRARENAIRILRAKVAALNRGGYRVVDGDLVAEADIEAATTVDTGTYREELADD